MGHHSKKVYQSSLTVITEVELTKQTSHQIQLNIFHGKTMVRSNANILIIQ